MDCAIEVDVDVSAQVTPLGARHCFQQNPRSVVDGALFFHANLRATALAVAGVYCAVLHFRCRPRRARQSEKRRGFGLVEWR